MHPFLLLIQRTRKNSHAEVDFRYPSHVAALLWVWSEKPELRGRSSNTNFPEKWRFFFFVCTEIYIFLVFYVDDYVHVYIICICKIILVFYNIKVFFLYRGEFMPWKKSDGLERFFWTNAPRKFFRRTFQNGALVKWRLDLLGLIRIDIPYLLEWVYIYIYIHVSHYMLRF